MHLDPPKVKKVKRMMMMIRKIKNTTRPTMWRWRINWCPLWNIRLWPLYHLSNQCLSLQLQLRTFLVPALPTLLRIHLPTSPPTQALHLLLNVHSTRRSPLMDNILLLPSQRLQLRSESATAANAEVRTVKAKPAAAFAKTRVKIVGGSSAQVGTRGGQIKHVRKLGDQEKYLLESPMLFLSPLTKCLLTFLLPLAPLTLAPLAPIVTL